MGIIMMDIEIYITEEGKEPFNDFLDSLKTYKDRARIEARFDRVENGNLGDHNSVGDGIHELRFFFGPGYRVYYGVQNKRLIILLCAGNKKTQRKDIRTAKEYWKNHKTRRKTK